MTTTVSAESAARAACRAAGLPDRPLTRLHDHATSVFLLATEGIVVRVSPAAQQRSLETAVALTRWLVTNEFPATEPATIVQPVRYDPFVVTFWRHYPQVCPVKPTSEHLGALLRSLHALPSPPVGLPEYLPLTSLKPALEGSTFLEEVQREWLMQRRAELLRAYDELDFPLGRGHIHGDAYPGNTLWEGIGVRLGDWDEAAFGPREIDLANTFQGVRFGRTHQELDDFSRAYGYDIRTWTGLPVLCEIRDLHTLGAYIRRADHGDEAAQEQLCYRISTLMNRSDSARWEAA